MDDTDFNTKLRELIKTVANLSEKDIKKLKPSGEIDDTFIELRICIQYVLFDLEATRRERDSLLKQLGRKPKRDIDEEPDSIEGEM